MFVAGAEGMGKNGVMISLHKDYADFRKFMDNLKFNSDGYMKEVDSMLVCLRSGTIVKPLSFSPSMKIGPSPENTSTETSRTKVLARRKRIAALGPALRADVQESRG
jgi:hypothetical protein